MEGIVFFGKGGVGKSTVATNVSVVLARGGRKVLHAGCDPKMDSTLALMGRHIPPFGERAGGAAGEAALRASIFPAKVPGVHCIEAGGPEPGVGCAGLGIGAMLDAMKDGELLERDGYGAAVFDVLGDVVCGGFAAPLRRGFAKKVVIVTSETLLSLYAANRLIRMIENYSRNGVYLAGLAVNAIRPEGVAAAEKFAAAAGTRILGILPRDPSVAKAEREHRPAVLAAPGSPFSLMLVRLASAIRAAGAPARPPRALPEDDFFRFMRGEAPRQKAAAGVQAPAEPRGSGSRSPAASLEAAGFSPAGLEGGQLLLDWRSPAGVFRVVLAPASSSRPGVTAFSDWSVCFHPSAGRESEKLGAALAAAASRLAGLSFSELLSALTGDPGLYAAGAPAPHGETRQHLGGGGWPRFIFAGSEVDSLAPPDSVMAMHGDAECRFCICEGGVFGAFSENACVKPESPDLPGPVLPRSDEREPSTDLRSQEAVFGDEEKLLSAMRAAAAQAGPGGLAEFYVGCSPLLLASDAGAFAAKVERETGVRFWLDKYCSLGKHSPAKTELRAGFMARKFRAAAGRPERDVNLVYYGSCPPALPELLRLGGISAAEPGEKFYAEARRARLQVLSAPDAVLTEAYGRAGLRWLLPPAPYGFSGTSAWFAAVAGALKRRRLAEPSAAQLKAAAQLRLRARGLAAAFVLPAAEADRAAGENAFRRVPVLRLLKEGGFEARFFVLAAGRPAAKAALAALRPHGEVKVFGDPAELPRLLRADRAVRLVYSDMRGDPRAAAAGKVPFSAALFEPGYEGALESWRRLLELCDWDFNERYFAAK